MLLCRPFLPAWPPSVPFGSCLTHISHGRGRAVAIKQLSIDTPTIAQMEDFIFEGTLMKPFHHPNLVRQHRHHFWIISHAFLCCCATLHTRRVTCPTQCPSLSDADRGLRSHAVSDWGFRSGCWATSPRTIRCSLSPSTCRMVTSISFWSTYAYPTADQAKNPRSPRTRRHRPGVQRPTCT